MSGRRHDKNHDRYVKVTAHLAGPLALSPEGTPPYLDALVEWAMSAKMRSIEEASGGRHKAERSRRRGEPVSKPGRIPIPIARRQVDGLPIPRCSIGILPGFPERVEHFARRFPSERARQLDPEQRTVLQTTGGAYKSFRLPLRIVDVDRVVWFAAVREAPGRLRRELKPVTGLGKKTSQGFGRIDRWEVERIDDDRSWFAESEAGPVLMRPLPIATDLPDDLVGHRRSYCGVCPPYWQRDLWREAVVPC